MSGPSNESTGLPGGGQRLSFNCQNVSIRTSIISPDPNVLDTLEVGDILNITINNPTGPVIAVTSDGRVLGSVFTHNLADLIACLNDDVAFEGKILSISGGDCQILITTA